MYIYILGIYAAYCEERHFSSDSKNNLPQYLKVKTQHSMQACDLNIAIDYCTREAKKCGRGRVCM